MKISIIIPAYNEEKYIGKTLRSIKKLEVNSWDTEIVIVNGDSTDKTVEIAESFGAKVINKAHKSIGFARQEGLKEVSGDIVLFTDADTTVPSNWLKFHVEALLKPKTVCSYGTYRVADGKFPYYHITNYLQPQVVALAYNFGVYLAGGQNIAAWRKEALSMGGFDDRLELLEDADFVKKMSKIGKVAFLPDCIVYSSGRRSNEGLKYFSRAGWADFKYFVLGKRTFQKFPDYR